MRVALCLHGLYSGINTKKFRQILGKECYQVFKTQLIDNYEVDVFIHSWSLQSKDEILELYNPKLYKIESQIDFSKKKYDRVQNKKFFFNLYSNFYSYKQVNDLKKLYEKENNFKYDCVIHSRFDLLIYLHTSLTNLDLTKFYFPRIVDDQHRYYVDYIFISSSKNMDIFCELYDKIEEYYEELIKKATGVLLNHRLCEIHLTKNNLLDDNNTLEEKYLSSKIALNQTDIDEWHEMYNITY